jgi:hypothetical protein
MSESSSSVSATPIAQVSIWQRSAAALRDLSAHDAALLLGLLALNALVCPYKGIMNDAALYGFQVANHIEGGRYADDIYFRYGSQDQYTIFSSLAVPVARLVGLPTAFFLLYLFSKAFFLWAALRFFRALVEDRLVSTLAVIVIAIVPLSFGAMNVFAVNEDVLTPRLLGCALTICALQQLLRDRLVTSLALLLVGLLIHPLMAFPGLLVYLGWFLTGRLSRAWALGGTLLLGVLAGVVLGYQDLGVRLLGFMDEPWHDAVRRAAFVGVLEDWHYEDWLRMIISAGIVAAGCFCPALDGRQRRLLALVLLVALLGLVGDLLACRLPYALLMQGQPWRALWLLETVKLPVAFLLVAEAWTRERPLARAASLAMLAYLAVSFHGAAEVTVALPLVGVAFLPLAVFWRGLAPLPRAKDWLWRAAASSLVVGLVVREALRFFGLVGSDNWAELAGTPQDQLLLLLACADPWLRLVAGTGLLLLAYRLFGAGRPFCAVAATAFVVLQVGNFAIPEMGWYARWLPKQNRDVAAVGDFLKANWREERPPTLYWPGARWRVFWFDLRASCYFEWPNAVTGILFSRGQALEAIRRTQVVKSFEMDRLRRAAPEWHVDPFKGWMERLYQAEMDNQPEPNREDLRRLCREEKVDFVVLPQCFEGLYAARQGSWFIYDCRTVCDHCPEPRSDGAQSSCCKRLDR